MPGNLQNLSVVLRAERERAGLSVRQLAEAAGLAASTVSRLERGLIGTPGHDQLQRLAQALEIDVEELYAAVGYLAPTAALPPLRTYLRDKYGLSDREASRMEGYLQAVRDTNQQPGKEGRDDRRDEAP